MRMFAVWRPVGCVSCVQFGVEGSANNQLPVHTIDDINPALPEGP